MDGQMMGKMEREYVKSQLARKFYLAHCAHRGFEPRERVDSWAYEYAEIAIDTLGYDEQDLANMFDTDVAS